MAAGELDSFMPWPDLEHQRMMAAETNLKNDAPQIIEVLSHLANTVRNICCTTFHLRSTLFLSLLVSWEPRYSVLHTLLHVTFRYNY